MNSNQKLKNWLSNQRSEKWRICERILEKIKDCSTPGASAAIEEEAIIFWNTPEAYFEISVTDELEIEWFFHDRKTDSHESGTLKLEEIKQ